MGARAAARIYFATLVATLRGQMEYRGDFLLRVGPFILWQLGRLLFILVAFRFVPDIAGWTYHQVLLVYALAELQLFLYEMVAGGAGFLPQQIVSGQFDRILVYPAHPLVVAAARSGHILDLFGCAVPVVVLLRVLPGLDLAPTPGQVLGFLLLLANGFVIDFAMALVVAAVPLWWPGNRSLGRVLAPLWQFRQYPLDLYDPWLRRVFLSAVPIGYITFVPATLLFGMERYRALHLAAPVVGVAALAAGVWLFQQGLRRYQSRGS